MSQEKTKVYIYTRVSTAMQIDGYSLDAQKARMKAYADFNDYQIVGEYEDLISEIQIYPERQPNGQWLKSIKFRLPIVESDIDLYLDNESHTECVLSFSKV